MNMCHFIHAIDPRHDETVVLLRGEKVDVHIEVDRDKNGQVLGVTINGVPVMRDDSLDLDLEPKKAKRYMCITCSLFEYCVEQNGITGECMSCEDYERVE